MLTIELTSLWNIKRQLYRNRVVIDFFGNPIV